MATTRSVDDDVLAWLRTTAAPLASDDPNATLADLAPLQEVLQDTCVVGLGESTHGTREFFRMRHRVLEFLIEELGFNTLALEASYSAVDLLNAYVSGATGDVRSLLADLHLMWNIEEFVATIEWIRSYNERSRGRKVRLHGLDIFPTRPGREWLTPYIERAFPHRSEAMAETFRELEEAESGGWLTAHNYARLAAYEELDELLGEVGHDMPDAEEATRQLRVLKQWEAALILQWVTVRLKDSLPQLVPALTPFGVLARTRYLAQNLDSILERDPGAKVAVWAHNLHVAKRYEDPEFGALPTMGHYLQERWGPAYYSLGLEMGAGAYRAREWLSERAAFGSLVTPEVPRPPNGSLAWYLAPVEHAQYFVDFRSSRTIPAVADWLDRPLQMYSMGAAYMDPPLLYTQMTPGLGFDGLIFVHDTTPTTPTPEALALAALEQSS
jgi:erythromycin esterase